MERSKVFYSSYAVYLKGEDCDFPIAVFMDLQEAQKSCALSKNRYIMSVTDSVELNLGIYHGHWIN